MNLQSTLRQEITEALFRRRIVMLIGPRQCGKIALAREFVSVNSQNYFDLEDLELSPLFVIYPGDISYDLSDKIKVVPFLKMADEVKMFG